MTKTKKDKKMDLKLLKNGFLDMFELIIALECQKNSKLIKKIRSRYKNFDLEFQIKEMHEIFAKYNDLYDYLFITELSDREKAGKYISFEELKKQVKI